MKKSILLIFLLLLIVGLACKNRDDNHSSETNQSLKSGPGVFVVYTIYANPEKQEQFLNFLKTDYLPVWRKLKEGNTLSELSVFKITPKDSLKKRENLCNYLILAQLYPGVKAEKFLKTQEPGMSLNADKNSLFQVQRSEVLKCTANAYYPAVNTKRNDIIYLLEFIAVKDSADFVNQYHTLMQKYFGPLNGVLVNEEKLHSIFMLETAEMLFQKDSRFNWNQLHISSDFPEFVDINWDSLYTALFRQMFLCELDSVWALLPPSLETSFDCKGKLINELHIR